MEPNTEAKLMGSGTALLTVCQKKLVAWEAGPEMLSFFFPLPLSLFKKVVEANGSICFKLMFGVRL